MKVKYEICIGLNKGHQVTKFDRKPRPAAKKGRLTKHNKFIRSIVREISGFSPYEKRGLEYLRMSKDKRALKFLKHRLGTHAQGKRKRDELTHVLIAQRKAASHKP